MDREALQNLITQEVLKALPNENDHKNSVNILDHKNIPIAVSNRHVHLSPADLERLFGRNYRLKKDKELSQPGQFAAEEKVTIIGPKGRIANVRVLGPSRGETQVEISLKDGYTLGVHPPIRDSGDLEGTPPITLQGPRGQITIHKGCICAARHIHMHPNDAQRLEVVDGQRISVHVQGDREVRFGNVLVRVSPRYRLEMHIDMDEANAGQIRNGDMGMIVKDKMRELR